MSSPRALRLFACVLSFALSSACKDACLSLANEICACQPDSNAAAICNQQAQQRESAYPVGSQDEKFCQQKLDSQACNCGSFNSPAQRTACCDRLATAEGRAACGLDLTPP